MTCDYIVSIMTKKLWACGGMVDTVDSKSTVSNGLGVQIPSRLPLQRIQNPLHNLISVTNP